MTTNSELQPDRANVLDESHLGYFGWRVAIAACLGVMGGFGSLFVYTFTVFVKPLGAQFGWNREAVSLGFAIAAMTVGMASPLIGRLIDRFGPRRIILPCMTVFGCGIAAFALLRSGIWQFYVTCFVIGVVGNGAAHLAYARSISTWFERRLGTALAIVMVGAIALTARGQEAVPKEALPEAPAPMAELRDWTKKDGFAILFVLLLGYIFIRAFFQVRKALFQTGPRPGYKTPSEGLPPEELADWLKNLPDEVAETEAEEDEPPYRHR